MSNRDKWRPYYTKTPVKVRDPETGEITFVNHRTVERLFLANGPGDTVVWDYRLPAPIPIAKPAT